MTITLSTTWAASKGPFAIQFGSFKTVERAQRHQAYIQSIIHDNVTQDLRILHTSSHYSVRGGCFGKYTEASRVLEKIQHSVPDASLVNTAWPQDRTEIPEKNGSEQMDFSQIPSGKGPPAKIKTSSQPTQRIPSAMIASPHKPIIAVADTETPSNNRTKTDTSSQPSGKAAPLPGVSFLASRFNENPTLPLQKETSPHSGEKPGEAPSSSRQKNLSLAQTHQKNPSPDQTSPDLFKKFGLALQLGGAILTILLFWFLFRLRGGHLKRTRILTNLHPENQTTSQQVHSSPSDMNITTHTAQANHTVPPVLPRLSPAFEQRLQNNARELTMVESNLLSVSKNLQVIYLASCFPGEGKTTAAIETAYALAVQSGRKVLLIDWGEGNERIPLLFNDQSTRFPDPKNGAQNLAGYTRTAYHTLDYITFKNDTKKYPRLHEENLKSKLTELRSVYDYIIVDGISVLGSSFPLCTELFDGIIMVVEAEKTKWEVVQMATAKLQNLGAHVVGTILNKRKHYLPWFVYKNI